MTTVSVIIASMNEEESIAECLNKIYKAFKEHRLDGEVIVADNSKDCTPHIAKNHGARVVTPSKLGYGNALIHGINQANGKYIVMGDADGTYEFNDIPRLLEPLVKGEAELVLGSRFAGEIKKGAMPWLHRYIGNPLLTLGLNLKLGTRISDAHCGIRSFTKDAWDKMDHKLISEDFCSEVLRQMTKNKAKITEIPVNYYPRKGKVKVNTLIHGWRCFKFLIFRVFLNR